VVVNPDPVVVDASCALPATCAGGDHKHPQPEVRGQAPPSRAPANPAPTTEHVAAIGEAARRMPTGYGRRGQVAPATTSRPWSASFSRRPRRPPGGAETTLPADGRTRQRDWQGHALDSRSGALRTPDARLAGRPVAAARRPAPPPRGTRVGSWMRARRLAGNHEVVYPTDLCGRRCRRCAVQAHGSCSTSMTCRARAGDLAGRGRRAGGVAGRR